MAMIGMDVQAVQNLAKTFGNKATDIDNIIKHMNGQLSGVGGGNDWKGKDATTFKSNWNNTLVPMLRKVAAELRRAENTAKKNASAQATTSSNL